MTVASADSFSYLTVTGYSPGFKLMFNTAIPLSSVVLLYDTPLIVISTVLFGLGFPLLLTTVTFNASFPL